jgi:hypothetical protein
MWNLVKYINVDMLKKCKRIIFLDENRGDGGAGGGNGDD